MSQDDERSRPFRRAGRLREHSNVRLIQDRTKSTEPIVSGCGERTLNGHTAAATVALASVVGFVARVASTRLPLFHDEAATLLAAKRIRDIDIPKLPGGVLHLHGAVISSLLAPRDWLGRLDSANVENLRIINAVIGTAAIVLACLVGRTASGSLAVGVGAAVLAALDPVKVLWGSSLRR